MKLGKKKKPDDAVADQSDNPSPAESKPRKRAASGPRLKRMGSVAGTQAAVVFVAGLLAAGLIHFLIVGPAESRRAQLQAAVEVDTAANRLNQHVALLQAAVSGLAAQGHVREALASPQERQAVTDELAGALPGVRAVHLFPYGDIPRSASGSDTLGFAGLDLARRAESGRSLHPDAFPRDNQWYFQLAAPIRNPNNQAMAGSMLVVFDAAQLRPLLAVNNDQLGGQLALVQTVGGSARVVVSNGTGGGAALERGLGAPDWSISYKPASAPAPVVSAMLSLILVLAPVLVAAIVVWMLLGAAQRSIRQDVTALTQWAQKVFGGERLKLPALRWDMVASAGEVLQQKKKNN